MIPNMNYQNLKESYLFYNIAQKTKAYLEAHPGAHLYRMGIGDVSLPLCDAVIQKLHEAAMSGSGTGTNPFSSPAGIWIIVFPAITFAST